MHLLYGFMLDFKCGRSGTFLSCYKPSLCVVSIQNKIPAKRERQPGIHLTYQGPICVLAPDCQD